MNRKSESDQKIMATLGIPVPRDLPNKPLAEAIFEVHWTLKPEGETRIDPGFQIFLGRFYDRISKDYPMVQDLPSAQLPVQLTPNAVRHQFRCAQDEWPLVQIGPGVLTLNETIKYKWPNFRQQIVLVLDGLYSAYPQSAWVLKASDLHLRYIDAIDFSESETDPLRFIEKYLHTNVTIASPLFSSEKAPRAESVNFVLTYPLENCNAKGTLQIATGQHQGMPRIVLNTHIHTDVQPVPNSRTDIVEWVDAAHDVSDQWFFSLCQGELLKKFGYE